MKDLSKVLDLYKERKWKEIADGYHDHPERSKLLWVFPSAENFQFLSECTKELNCDRILSIGCGSGLLEWMITEATGIPVSGVEVDGAWWHCKYAPPTFIPLTLTSSTPEDGIINTLQDATTTALLFCYFNNRPAFEYYLKHYRGTVLIIIGPDNKGVHTDPQPFEDLAPEWKLYNSQEVRNSKDFIAVYFKNHINSTI